jgi:acyl dehydratase
MNTSGSRLSALYIGQRAELTRTFDTAAIKRWCALAAMPQTPSNVPEPLIAGLFSCLLGEQLPGHGTNYLKQHMDFWRAAPIGARLMASVTITAIRAEKALVDLDTQCVDTRGRLLCNGRALVLFDL